MSVFRFGRALVRSIFRNVDAVKEASAKVVPVSRHAYTTTLVRSGCNFPTQATGRNPVSAFSQALFQEFITARGGLVTSTASIFKGAASMRMMRQGNGRGPMFAFLGLVCTNIKIYKISMMRLNSMQGVVKTPEEEKESNTLKALASDISEGLKHVKRSGSNEKRAAYKALKSLAFGDNIKKSRAKKSLGKLVGLNEKSISKAIKTREEILKGEGESWLYVKRKTRRDALPEEDVEKIYCFWASSASRPTGDKSDFVKNRVGKKQYLTHPKHVLETSQTEAFQEFAKLHPEVKVAQRKFEMLKPYFVKQARERDRKSCLCRKHVETKILFDACMKFRKGVVKTTGNESEESPIFKTLTEAADATLCSKEDGIEHHKIECLERDCNRCSVEKIKLLPEESSNEGSVCWSRKAKINSAKDMYAYLVANFTEPAATSYAARRTATQLTRRVFFYVPAKGEGAVSRNRDGRKFKEAKGIRKWHCVKTLPQQEKVLVRHRTCYCVSCIVKDEDSCTNKAWLDEWKEVTIPRDGSVAITRQATEQPALEHDTASHMADLAACGSTVAIEAEGDRMYDFYLLKVTSAGVEELEHDYTDDYHNTALRGESVLKGHFYLRDNIHDMTFTLNEKRIAVVYAATVRHICGDLPTKKRGKKLIYKLPLKENEAILAIL
ncbi:predicted protein [Nematostella vectensis]|uniref:Uncharacterized protein n=1 Tax=Nematostella vectensis TaxID=45351 RepID=A7RMS7_NEMVE|nr:predicted protein [Nematostella vectensis]|eukprot:XP_001639212.1 predicted protein [Nematostella vectensis]